MKILKSLFACSFLMALSLTFVPTDSFALMDDDVNCHMNGSCTDICGIEEQTPCTYMDCGGGTQICMKRN